VGANLDFDAFVAAHGRALLQTAYLVSGSRDRAQDLVQAALEKAFRSWPRVQRADAPLAYVRQIVVREHLSWARSRAASERIGLFGQGTEAPDASEAVVVQDTVWRLLATLPDRQRAVLVLRLFDDLSDNDIAAALGCRASTVRAYAARAHATLRSHPSLEHLSSARNKELL
jgi:RNA polymerase sigma-70 factor (sigma-E family)